VERRQRIRSQDSIRFQGGEEEGGCGGGIERVGRGLVEETETTGNWIRETKSSKMGTRDQGW